MNNGTKFAASVVATAVSWKLGDWSHVASIFAGFATGVLALASAYRIFFPRNSKPPAQ